MSEPAKALTSAEDLVAAGLVPPGRREAIARVAARYAVSITPAVAALIDAADPADPIARQFVPDPREFDRGPAERADPIGDDAFSPLPGLVHRHPDRVLLKLVNACPVYCRFCFRREMVGPGAGALTPEALDAALAYIAGHPDIWEVVFTGGDPFMVSARRAAEVVERLAAIAHVKVLRWHTRVPVVAPERVTADFVAALKSPNQATWVVLHANHARELSPAARAACARLVDAGIPMLSQSVLLAGINDDPDVLAALMRALVETRIKPYYLHHADLAPGTAHHRTSLATGRELVRALRRTASGLAQPTYVLDLPGGFGKVPVSPDYVAWLAEDGRHGEIDDAAGCRHAYPPTP
ncbi:lysine-2,3-aminomutase-like protein [Blastochloris tepida]|uniref:Lysine 2,3-aminomutase n=1 Tax=Blastochloris tepida TaxID=2233851 RepID=A0A348G4I5_9HYPH|nr:lysine-2,3-aminomutase-like protein [Blastochloris tepida]BBF94468.1 lysine 2,3-aminomutase [Blastochloris tepida]